MQHYYINMQLVYMKMQGYYDQIHVLLIIVKVEFL